MVKRIFKFLLYLMFFILSLIYFTPKASVYYFAETKLRPYAIIISSEEIKEDTFSLNINKAQVSFKSIQTASISEVNIKLFAIYNHIAFKNVALSSTAKSFLPTKIQRADITYSIIDPLNLNAKISGDFGEAILKFNIVENKIHVRLKASDLMLKEYSHMLRQMSKIESGEYIYDKDL